MDVLVHCHSSVYELLSISVHPKGMQREINPFLVSELCLFEIFPGSNMNNIPQEKCILVRISLVH